VKDSLQPFAEKLYRLFYNVTLLAEVASNRPATAESLLRPQVSLMLFVLDMVALEQVFLQVQGGSNMTGTNCDLFTHK
jgi:hypothetical protein